MSIPSSDSSEHGKSVTAEASDIRGLKPLEVFAYPWWYYAGGVFLGLLVVWLMAWASRKLLRRKKKQVTPSLPPEPLHVVILRRLEEARKNISASNLRHVYFDVSEIFRDYLEGHFGFPASDWTIEEIINHVMARSESDVSISQVNSGDCFARARNDTVIEILTQLDEVKFAGRKPDISDLLRWIDQIERFVSL